MTRSLETSQGATQSWAGALPPPASTVRFARRGSLPDAAPPLAVHAGYKEYAMAVAAVAAVRSGETFDPSSARLARDVHAGVPVAAGAGAGIPAPQLVAKDARPLHQRLRKLPTKALADKAKAEVTQASTEAAADSMHPVSDQSLGPVVETEVPPVSFDGTAVLIEALGLMATQQNVWSEYSTAEALLSRADAVYTQWRTAHTTHITDIRMCADGDAARRAASIMETYEAETQYLAAQRASEQGRQAALLADRIARKKAARSGAAAPDTPDTLASQRTTSDHPALPAAVAPVSPPSLQRSGAARSPTETSSLHGSCTCSAATSLLPVDPDVEKQVAWQEMSSAAPALVVQFCLCKAGLCCINHRWKRPTCTSCSSWLSSWGPRTGQMTLHAGVCHRLYQGAPGVIAFMSFCALTCTCPVHYHPCPCTLYLLISDICKPWRRPLPSG